jgi:hypothetical protein
LIKVWILCLEQFGGQIQRPKLTEKLNVQWRHIFSITNTNRWPGSKVPYLFISTFADMIKTGSGRVTFDSLILWNLKDYLHSRPLLPKVWIWSHFVVLLKSDLDVQQTHTCTIKPTYLIFTGPFSQFIDIKELFETLNTISIG